MPDPAVDLWLPRIVQMLACIRAGYCWCWQGRNNPLANMIFSAIRKKAAH